MAAAPGLGTPGAAAALPGSPKLGELFQGLDNALNATKSLGYVQQDSSRVYPHAQSLWVNIFSPATITPELLPAGEMTLFSAEWSSYLSWLWILVIVAPCVVLICNVYCCLCCGWIWNRDGKPKPKYYDDEASSAKAAKDKQDAKFKKELGLTDKEVKGLSKEKREWQELRLMKEEHEKEFAKFPASCAFCFNMECLSCGDPQKGLHNWCLCGVLCIWLIAGLAIGTGYYSFHLTKEALHQAQPDVDEIVGQVKVLQPQFQNAAVWMNGWEESCAGWDLISSEEEKKAIERNTQLELMLNNASYTLYQVDLYTRDAPQLLAEGKATVQDIAENHRFKIFFLLFWPTILVTIVILILNRAVTSYDYEPQMYPMTFDFVNYVMFDLCAVPIFVLIAIMAVFCAFIFGVGVTTSNFCRRPEDNIVNYATVFEHGNTTHELVYMTKYYLQGPPLINEVNEQLYQVYNVVKPLAQNMFVLGPAIDALGVLCSRLANVNLGPLIKEARSALALVIPLSQRSNIYGHYDKIVNRGVCGLFLDSVGTYLLCQVLVGLLVLPMVTVLTYINLVKINYDIELAKPVPEAPKEYVPDRAPFWTFDNLFGTGQRTEGRRVKPSDFMTPAESRKFEKELIESRDGLYADHKTKTPFARLSADEQLEKIEEARSRAEGDDQKLSMMQDIYMTRNGYSSLAQTG